MLKLWNATQVKIVWAYEPLETSDTILFNQCADIHAKGSEPTLGHNNFATYLPLPAAAQQRRLPSGHPSTGRRIVAVVR